MASVSYAMSRDGACSSVSYAMSRDGAWLQMVVERVLCPTRTGADGGGEGPMSYQDWGR